MTMPQSWAAEKVTHNQKSQKKKTAKEKREAAKAKRAEAKAKKAAAKARKEAEKKAAQTRADFESAEPTPPVGKALKELPYIGNARPDLTAEFYVVVRSSSTCPHCVKLLPEVMAAYKEMRATGKVELIYESFDNSAEKAEEHLMKQGVSFPAAMRADMGKLPGAAPLIIPPPAAYIIDAQGNRLASGPLPPSYKIGANTLLRNLNARFYETKP
ncbi:MAG: hypothetical protein E7030_05860 [Akkermansiaceae bacterium]|nr:hypothetical protein [Akkermansiaceae bacterium]